MRALAEAELLNIHKLLQMETSMVTKSKALVAAIDDDELKRAGETFILAGEARIKGIQQFLIENNIVDKSEVH